MNRNSSRSHVILRVWVNKIDNKRITQSILNFVDLAGSERLSINNENNEKKEKRMSESKNINKSLFFLT